MIVPSLVPADARWFHDDMIDLVCRLGAAAMCFGMAASLAMFAVERTRRR